MGADEERVVLEFLRATEGQTQDVDAMISLMADNLIWQINVPLAPVIVGLDDARAEIERQNKFVTGMQPGSELLSIASNGPTVFTERVDVVHIGRKSVSFRINGLFEVHDGKITVWREYFDTLDAAQQLGVDGTQFYAGITPSNPN